MSQTAAQAEQAERAARVARTAAAVAAARAQANAQQQVLRDRDTAIYNAGQGAYRGTRSGEQASKNPYDVGFIARAKRRGGKSRKSRKSRKCKSRKSRK